MQAELSPAHFNETESGTDISRTAHAEPPPQTKKKRGTSGDANAHKPIIEHRAGKVIQHLGWVRGGRHNKIRKTHTFTKQTHLLNCRRVQSSHDTSRGEQLWRRACHRPGASLVVLVVLGCQAFQAMREALAAPDAPQTGALADAPQGPGAVAALRAGSRAETADAGDADMARLAGRSPRAESEAAGPVRGVAAGTGGRPPRRALAL